VERPGRGGRTLQEFFELLGEHEDSITAISIDMSEPYAGAIRRWLPEAEIAFDPFHVVAMASRSTRAAGSTPTPWASM
jgi:transposase